MMIKITKRLEWDAAHRVLGHESKCSTLHGHRFVALVTVTAPKLDTVGRVVDFSVIKAVLGKWIDDNWDHTTIVNPNDGNLMEFVIRDQKQHGKRAPYVMPFHAQEPTAENIALVLMNVAETLLPQDLGVLSVVVYETPTSSAECCND